MNPNRVDFLIDVAYGVLIFVSVVLIVVVEMDLGVAFGVGALIAYMIHVAWKMARFDPEWMTRAITEDVEEAIATEVADGVEQKMAEEVTAAIEETVSREMDAIDDKLQTPKEPSDQ